MRPTTAEPLSAIHAIAEAGGRAGAQQVLAQALTNGLRAPKTWLMAKDCAADGPYTAPTLCNFIAEGRGPKFIPVGGYMLTCREWWDAWIERGGLGPMSLARMASTTSRRCNCERRAQPA